jgi:hypothetical protein
MAAFGHIKKGAFHRWLGKSEDEPITEADIQKGLKAGGHAAKMASFARSAQEGKFKHKGKKKRDDSEHAERMYGKESKSKRETLSAANHPGRQNIRRVGAHP